MVKVIILASVMIIFLFLIGCAKTVSDTEIQAELKQMSNEELGSIIEETEENKNSALAGRPTAVEYQIQIGNLAYLVPNERMLKLAKIEKLRRGAID